MESLGIDWSRMESHGVGHPHPKPHANPCFIITTIIIFPRPPPTTPPPVVFQRFGEATAPGVRSPCFGGRLAVRSWCPCDADAFC